MPSINLVVSMTILSLILAACSSALTIGTEHVQKGEWIQALRVFRKAAKEDPQDQEIKIKLHQTELAAANFFYEEGVKFQGRGDLDQAIFQFRQGLTAMPRNEKIAQALQSTLALKEADSLYLEGSRRYEAGNLEAAIQNFEKALEVYSDHKKSELQLARIREQMELVPADKLILASKQPILLKFRQTEIRTAFEFIGKSFGVNIIFDDSIKSVPITLFAENVSFDQAFNLLLTTSKTFSKKIGPNTVLVAPDTQEKRGQYEDLIVRTFHLNTINSKEMLDILKGIVTPKKVIVNKVLNTIIVRDTKEVHQLVERLILLNDRKPAEAIVDVEIIEVNRNKAELLGFDLGSEINATFDQFPVTGSFSEAFKQGTVTLPAITFRYFKQDVDAKTLANPQIRVINGKVAKIHIGDRVPLRSSTIQDSTGQTRTTFVYTDIGIRLRVETNVHLDNSVTIKLGLEVSTLGQNLGTPDEPAFAIGTRNAETFMLLRDGETAILGGLIRDEERNTTVRVPGLGDIPIIGLLFTSTDKSAGRTDLLLTITPRVLRSWDLPPKSDLAFFSGSINRYSDRPLFSSLQNGTAKFGKLPKIKIGRLTSPQKDDKTKQTAVPSKSPISQGVTFPSQPLFSFSQPVYEGISGKEFEIELVGNGLSDTKSLLAEILFNPDLVELIRWEKGSSQVASLVFETEKTKGVAKLNIGLVEGIAPQSKTVLAKVIMRAKKTGISYLLYKAPKLQNASGKAIDAQLRASRVRIK